MRKVLRASQVLTLSLLPALAAVSQGLAEDILNLNQNQTGFSLPGVTLPQGQDEVHASDGTTCRSAVSGSGAYLDLGIIRGNNSSNQANSDIATYGRVVIPIGRTPKRVDCSRLYELEVERLQLELKLLKMGLGADGQTTGSVAASTPQGPAPQPSAAQVSPAQASAAQVKSAGWANEGWSIRGTTGNEKKKKRK
ncbi:hypothetical protein EN828_00055 [Mesorhizobium sp. M2D.F.Ca.ET.185.01.1.1]|uniref:hypothetical protein n=1 Tax=unclassified Mesorhizobium TaxID=325217 RepID=UPI000FCA412A|nr:MULTISPECIES: hypothetical protein [unclassified Mesorhizobium]TGP54103.1 hypothetical protein EN873_13220 [bacterium M00.F.Ca.ET.230.01.1.1]TGP83046.1 hypothetical protein EN870_00355 [bacterium M00.F.Ca.ET.227.01.1.1]TGP99003.1 hypothetical protein EN864_04255 [bacterium M00.F.Ca.ET.221.01.1.1]TGP99733.1 hypothetical protein EN865_04255 [bacterium M00.F.Ca.ET.222.01.1.1]TGT78150.1 hypothetical protein EN802_00350 [bacterium M00.F.Ca.ET.159.01.1.1]TGT88817.1 hypothetical protein EN800_003